MQKENYKAWLQTGTITDIAEHIYNWTEGNNVILEVGNRLRLLRQKLDKFRNDKSKKLVCIFNKDSNHWVTFVAVHDSDKDVIFYADSFGGTIDSCIVGSVRQKAPDSTINNNDQNVRQNDVIIIKEVEHDSTSYKSLKELLIGECSIDEEIFIICYLNHSRRTVTTAQYLL